MSRVLTGLLPIFLKRCLSLRLVIQPLKKEALSIVLALQHFQYYLATSQPTFILTDHKPLIYISSLSNVNRRLMRWALFLQNFNLKFKHVRGRDNVIADCLSRPS